MRPEEHDELAALLAAGYVRLLASRRSDTAPQKQLDVAAETRLHCRETGGQAVPETDRCTGSPDSPRCPRRTCAGSGGRSWARSLDPTTGSGCTSASAGMLQAQESGGLSKRAQERLEELLPLAPTWLPMPRSFKPAVPQATAV